MFYSELCYPEAIDMIQGLTVAINFPFREPY